MPAKRKIKINTHFFGGKHKCALPVWITWKGLRKNVKIIHILKKAGYKIGLPFGTAAYSSPLPIRKENAIIRVILCRSNVTVLSPGQTVVMQFPCAMSTDE